MLNIEQRKLIQFGGNSFVISLPINWVKKYNLNKGDTLFLSENKTSLEILPKEKKAHELKSIIIETDKKPLSRIQSEITAAYLQGHDILELRGKNLYQKALKIKNTIQNLAGPEIIEQTSEKIVAKDFMSFDKVSVKTIMRRIDIIIRAMINDSIDTIDKKNKKHYESIFQRDMDVNRLVFLAKRIIKYSLKNPHLVEKQKTNYDKLMDDYRTLGYVESVGDSIKRISRIIKNKSFSKQCLDKLKGVYSIMQKRYIDVVKSYYTDDKNLAYEIELESKKRLDMCRKCRLKYPETTEIVAHLKSMASDIKHIAREIIDRD